MKKCTINILDEVNTRIGGLEPQDEKFLYEKFGIMVEGARHTPQFQMRRWDGKIRFYDKNSNTYTKLLDEIIPYIVGWNYEIDIKDTRKPLVEINDVVDENYFNHPSIKLRPYQVKDINLLLVSGGGFGVFGTGYGKTVLTAALTSVYASKGIQSIIIVPSSDLVSQTVDSLKESLKYKDVTIGQYSGDIKDINHPIVVATWQSLQNSPHYMQFFQCVIVDECLDESTLITTPTGNKKIKDLKIGDKIISFNEDTNIFEEDEIVKVHTNLSNSSLEKMYEIEFDDNTIIKLTGNHKILTLNRGYVRADELNEYDEICENVKLFKNISNRNSLY